MARLGMKFRQNAFQTIPDVSFFDIKKNTIDVFVILEEPRRNGHQNKFSRQPDVQSFDDLCFHVTIIGFSVLNVVKKGKSIHAESC